MHRREAYAARQAEGGVHKQSPVRTLVQSLSMVYFQTLIRSPSKVYFQTLIRSPSNVYFQTMPLLSICLCLQGTAIGGAGERGPAAVRTRARGGARGGPFVGGAALGRERPRGPRAHAAAQAPALLPDGKGTRRGSMKTAQAHPTRHAASSHAACSLISCSRLVSCGMQRHPMLHAGFCHQACSLIPCCWLVSCGMQRHTMRHGASSHASSMLISCAMHAACPSH